MSQKRTTPARRLTRLVVSFGIVVGLAGAIVLWEARNQDTRHKALEATSQFIQDHFGPHETSGGTPLQVIPTAPITRPLQVDTVNGRYFVDGTGRAILLSGSHTWLNLQDGVLTDPPPAFNWTGWLDYLQANHHNFIRLWGWEQAKWAAESSAPYYFSPLPYLRTGPGNALDGKPKFDLTQFNQLYFDRLRQRVIDAGQRGIYVSIQLFNGWSVDPKPYWGGGQSYPWDGHPFNKSNNINGINGDTNGDRLGLETEELSIPSVTALQDAYVKKVVDTVNDLDNVLYEICNECAEGPGGVNWQYHMIDLIHAYEAGKPKQHPVGMTHLSADDSALFASHADWVSPGGDPYNLPATTGNKVVVADTDHLFGIGGDSTWVWEAFTRGYNPMFMDQYDDSYKLNGGGYDLDNPNDVNLRVNLGYVRAFASRFNLAAMTPHGAQASSGYALANPAAVGAAYLVFLPSGRTATSILRTLGIIKSPELYWPADSSVTVDLSATSTELSVEWFNPRTGEAFVAGQVTGGKSQSFTAPFAGDAVLYLYG